MGRDKAKKPKKPTMREKMAKAELDHYLRIASAQTAAQEFMKEWKASGQPYSPAVERAMEIFKETEEQLDDIIHKAATTEDPKKLELYSLTALTHGVAPIIIGLAQNPRTPRETVVALLENKGLRGMGAKDGRALELLEKLVAHPSMALGDNLGERAWLEGEVELIREEYEKGQAKG